MKNKLKILHIVPYYPPAYSFGGPVKGVYEMAKEQLKRGHKVTVLTTDVLNKTKRSGLPFYSEEDGIEVYRIKNFSHFLAAKLNLYFSTQINKFTSLNLEFDIVHYHDFRSVNNFFLSNYFKKRNIKQVMSPYGSMNKFNKTLLKTIYDFLMGDTVAKNIDMFLAVNNFEKNIIQNHTEKKVMVLPNSIDIDNQKGKKIHLRELYDVPSDNKIILFFSRLNKMKNPDMAIKAYIQLPKNLQDKSVLLIMGPDDGAVSELKELIKQHNLRDKVKLVPKLIGDEKWYIYDQSDVFILPSNDQAFPLVMLEAISRNLPVVTSEIALKETLPPRLGTIVEFSPNAFSQGLENFLKSNRPTGGREYIEKYYSIKIFTDKLIELYKEVIK